MHTNSGSPFQALCKFCTQESGKKYYAVIFHPRQTSTVTESQPQSEVIAVQGENQAHYANDQEREVRDDIQRVRYP